MHAKHPLAAGHSFSDALTMRSSSCNPGVLIELMHFGGLHRTDEERMICSASCAQEPHHLYRTQQI